MTEAKLAEIKAYCAKATAPAIEMLIEHGRNDHEGTELHGTADAAEAELYDFRTDLPAAVEEIERLNKHIEQITNGAFDAIQHQGKDQADLRASLTQYREIAGELRPLLELLEKDYNHPWAPQPWIYEDVNTRSHRERVLKLIKTTLARWTEMEGKK